MNMNRKELFLKILPRFSSCSVASLVPSFPFCLRPPCLLVSAFFVGFSHSGLMVILLLCCGTGTGVLGVSNSFYFCPVNNDS